MRIELLNYLSCPKCKGDLHFQSFTEDQRSHIWEGLLTCSCKQWFPIINGVPRMLLGELRGDYSDFVTRYENYIPDSHLETTNNRQKELKLKSSTSASFGYEWDQYNRFGWEEEDFNREIEEMDVSDFRAVYQEQIFAHTIPTFRRKTLLDEIYFENKFALDVGCGNGRYAFVARRFNAEVIGVDISSAVDVAFENTRGINGIHIIQADVFNLPLKKEIFDTIFSIGVLHHTTSCEQAVRKLVKFLKKGGVFSIHLYRKRNCIYEFVNSVLRKLTTRIPIRLCWKLASALTWIGKNLYKNRILFAGVNAFVSVYGSHHHNFDWYSAPIATHHTEEEVSTWLQEEGLINIVHDNPLVHGNSFFARIYPKWARNSNGTVKKCVHCFVPHWGMTIRGEKNNYL